jgi:hypothetical protein
VVHLSVSGSQIEDAAGSDIGDDGNGVLSQQRMHQLVRQHGPITDRVFTVEFLDRAAEAFAFTFG